MDSGKHKAMNTPLSFTVTRSKENFILVFAYFTQIARECGVTVDDLKKMFTSEKYPEIYKKTGAIQ